ncbi:hypothetical protein Tco_1216268 [Tanacetum coccineum]
MAASLLVREPSVTTTLTKPFRLPSAHSYGGLVTPPPIQILLSQLPNHPPQQQHTYKNGERLTSADEKMVIEKLLAYHPHSEDKIGCGIDYIMVDRHPHYRFARCLFVVRTDGGVIDFSYRKCIQAYKRSRS